MQEMNAFGNSVLDSIERHGGKDVRKSCEDLLASYQGLHDGSAEMARNYVQCLNKLLIMGEPKEDALKLDFGNIAEYCQHRSECDGVDDFLTGKWRKPQLGVSDLIDPDLFSLVQAIVPEDRQDYACRNAAVRKYCLANYYGLKDSDVWLVKNDNDLVTLRLAEILYGILGSKLANALKVSQKIQYLDSRRIWWLILGVNGKALLTIPVYYFMHHEVLQKFIKCKEVASYRFEVRENAIILAMNSDPFADLPKVSIEEVKMVTGDLFNPCRVQPVEYWLEQQGVENAEKRYLEDFRLPLKILQKVGV